MNERFRQKGVGGVEIILIVIVVGIIGALGYVFWQQQHLKKDTITTQSSQENKPKAGLQPEEIIKKIKEVFATKYTLLDLDTNNQPKEGELSVSVNDDAPIWKAKGYDFYTNYKGGSSLNSVAFGSDSANLPSEISKAVRIDIMQVYKDYGLTKSDTRIVDNAPVLEVYTGKGLVCTVEPLELEDSSNSATCGIIDQYDAAAKVAKPLYNVLPNKSSSTVLTGVTIVNSPVKGYQRAGAGVSSIEAFGGAAGLFYKKMGGMWTYFTITQEIIDCKRFTTGDLKNAFKGYQCYDYILDKESTVQ